MINQIESFHYEQITNNLNSLKTQLQVNKVELMAQEEREKIQKIYQSANEQLVMCNNDIRKIKALKREVSTNETYVQTLLALKECREEILEIRENSQERLSLIEKRQSLYNQEQLPTVANFSKLLADLCINYPHLEQDARHFKYVVDSSMGIIPKKLISSDAAKLMTFANKLENIPELADLYHAVINQHSSLKATLERKHILLANLATWVEREGINHLDFNNWPPEQKLYFLTRADQILNNPFETRFDTMELLNSFQLKNPSPSPVHSICGLIQTLWEENTKTSKKSDFWNHAPPFERRCHHLAETLELKNYLYRCKIEGLKKIISLRQPKENANTHLIVGAGPSGLINALMRKMQGLEFQIIEKRGEQKIPRENTITLGKNDPKDLEILFFLGVIADFTCQDNISLGHNVAPLMEVKIGDVENGLLDVLKELHGSDPVEYGTEVSNIFLTPLGEARVTLTNTEGFETSAYPASVTITDGFSGKTKHLLGISRIDLAKPTMIAYSIFKNVPQEVTTSTSLKYRISNALRGMALMVSVAVYKVFKNKSTEESFAKVIKDGPSAIFRIPDQDYLIRVMRKKEQEILSDYRNKINSIDKKLAKLETKPKTERNAAKIVVLEQERSDLQDLFNERLNSHAQKIHGILDFFQTVLNPSGHQMKQMPMDSSKNFLVDIQIGKAERDLVLVGNTPFLIRGDASHSTDPYSGYGCKTALEEIQADQHFYNQLNDIQNPISLSILASGHEFYQQRMINMGLKERHFYRKRTENFRRYLECAIAHEIVDNAEAGQLIRLHAKNTCKDNSLVEVSESEHVLAVQFQERVSTELKNSLNEKGYQPNGKQKINDLFLKNLSGNEKRLLKKALHQGCTLSMNLNDKEKKQLDALCGKLTFHNLQEGWMLAMLYQTDSILKRY